MFWNNTTHDLSNISCVRIVALTYEVASEACVKTKCTCCVMVPAANTCFGHTYALLASCPHTALAYNVKFEFEFVFKTVVPAGRLPEFFLLFGRLSTTVVVNASGKSSRDEDTRTLPYMR
jgi:hypothetical protein